MIGRANCVPLAKTNSGIFELNPAPALECAVKSFLALAMLASLSFCQAPPPERDTGLPNYDPQLVENERAACEDRGGRFAKGGLAGRFVCFEETRDAGQTCAAATDCEAVCLARSRTCSPIKPFFGCQDVLTSAGARTTLCVD